MHVLAIHMKYLMASTSSSTGDPPINLSELWGKLTCLWNKDSSNKLLIPRHNNVPMLMQDPLALMTHFILLLPLNVDLPIFTTVARSCFNLQLAQTLVRLAFTLSYNERSLLLGEFNANGQHLKTFGALMGQIIEKLEPTGIFSEEDYVIEMDEDSSSVMLDMNSLENEAARLLIPFLRTASLVKHYIYKLDLPEINEDDEEFDQLVKFLDLIVQDLDALGEQEEPMDQAISGRVNLIDVVQWFSDSGEELQMWCAEFADLACRENLSLARQAMRVNVLWKQPQLLRLHQDYDQIFQVISF